jgi:hypothetical protein
MQSSPASCHLLPIKVHIFSSARRSQAPSVYAPSLNYKAVKAIGQEKGKQKF